MSFATHTLLRLRTAFVGFSSAAFSTAVGACALSLAGLGLFCAAAPQAAAQSLEPFPSYASNGPNQPYYEIYQGKDVRIDFALPGLTHAQSVANPTNGIPFFVYAAAPLSLPIVFQPTASLWLDPFSLKVIPIGPNFELNFNWTSGQGKDVLLPCQVAVATVFPNTILVDASDLIEINFLSSPPANQDEMRPIGSLATGSKNVYYDAANNAYRFAYNDGFDPVEYTVSLNLEDNKKGSLRIDELVSGIFATRNAGFWYVRGNGQQVYPPAQFKNIGTHTLTQHFVSGNTVTLQYQDVVPNIAGTADVVNNRRFELTLRGRSLEIHGYDMNPAPKAADTYFAFTLGNVQWPSGSAVSQVRIPYMDQIGILMIANTRFVSSFIDIFHSTAQNHSPATLQLSGNQANYTEVMFYEPDMSGVSPAVDERGYVTISGRVEDCFVETSAGRSAGSDAAEELITVALTTLPANSAYSRDQSNIDRLVSWGFDKVLAWKFHWMNFGLNKRATTHAPADPSGGTEQEFRDMTAAAKAAGWRLSLYTDFYSLDQAPVFDDNPNYSEGPLKYINYEDAVRGADGQYLKGFQTLVDPTGGGGADYFTRLLSPLRSLAHYKREVQVLKQDYGINAQAFDVASIGCPDLIVTGDYSSGPGLGTTGNISGDPNSFNDRNIRDAILSYKHLFRTSGQLVDGPVVGEGGFSGYSRRFDSFYAGYIDGLWRALTAKAAPNTPGEGNQSELVLPDYEVRYVRPKMAGLFGMGEYERFFEQVPGASLPIEDQAMSELRATQIAYMHNGYLMTTSKPDNSGDFLTWAQQIKEYYTMISLSAEWKNAGLGTVAYREPFGGAVWKDLSTMYKTNPTYNFRKPVLRISYPSGLVMFVNHSDQTVFEGAWQIPTHGWAIENPNTGYKNLSVLDPGTGQRYDLVEAPYYVYGDANGTPRNFGGSLGTLTNLRVVRFDKGFTLTEELNGNITKL